MKNYISNYIGNTPLIKINDKLYAKYELVNPSGSIKDRIAKYIIDDAENNNIIKKGDTIIEASSGNSGIAFSMIAAERGYNMKVVMPIDMSEERKKILKLFGTEIIDVKENDFSGAIKLADKLAKKNNWFNPKQFTNLKNIECHKNNICQEIIKQTENLNLDISCFINGIGTGGTIMGIYQGFKDYFSINDIPKFIAMEPSESATLSGNKPGKHGIQGIGDGSNFLVDTNILDDIIQISTKEAYDKTRELIKNKGLFIGVTSAANILAAERWIEKNNPTGIVVTIISDRAERYLSLL
jgi:cysteine synthase